MEYSEKSKDELLNELLIVKEELHSLKLAKQNYSSQPIIELTNPQIIQHIFLTLFENATSGIILLNSDGDIKFITSNTKKLLGFSVSDEISASFSEMIHPNELHSVLKDFKTLLVDSSFIPTIQFRLMNKLGNWNWVEGTFKNLISDHIISSVVLSIKDFSAYKKDQEALRATEERLVSVLENSLDASYKRNLISNDYEYLSPVFTRITGYPVNDFISFPIDAVVSFIHPDDQINVKKIMSMALNDLSISPYQMDYRFKDISGKYIWIQDQFTILRDEDGLPSAIIGSVNDITSRKQAEQELIDEKKRLSVIIQATNIGTWEWNIKSGVTIYNDRWAEIIGYSLEEISPTSINSWISHVHPDDLIKSDILLKQHFKGELDYYECEARMKHKNGDWIWVLDRGRVHSWDVDGNPLLMSGTHQDITEKKQKEEKLKILSRAVEQSPISIVITDENGNIEFANAKVSKLTGYTIEEMIGNNPRIFSCGEIPKDKYKLLWDTILSGNEWNGEFHNKKKNGELYWERASISSIKNFEGKITHFLGVKEDITNQRLIETSLKKSEENLRVILESTNEGILAVDTNNNVIKTNSRFAELWGIPRDIINSSDDNVLLNFVLGQLLDPSEFLNKVNKLYHSTDSSIDTILFKDKRVFERSTNPLILDGNLMGRVWSFRDITDLRIAELELKKSEAKWRSYVESAPVGVLIADSNGIHIEANKYAEEMLGYKPGELLNTHFTDLASKEMSNEVERHLNEVITIGNSALQIQLKRKDGSLIWTTVNAVKLQDNFYMAMIQDISELKNTEKALLSNEQQLIEAQHIAQIGSWELDLISNELKWSDEIYKMFGIDKKLCVLSLNVFLEIVHPEDRDFVSLAYSSSIENNIPYDIEHRLLLKDGIIKYVHERCETYYDDDNNPIRSIGTVQDITDSKKAERIIRSFAEKYKTLLDTSRDGIHLLDTKGNLVECNDSFCRMLGYDKEDILQLNVKDWDAQTPQERLIELLNDLIENPNIFETIHRKKNGKTIIVEINASGVEIDEQKFLYASSRDITERKQLELALKESEDKYRTIAASTLDVIFILDKFGNQLYYSESIEKVMGYRVEDLIGVSFTKFVPAKEIQNCLINLKKAFSNEQINGFITQVYHKDGYLVDIEINAKLILYKGEYAVQGTYRDISQRKRIENALKVSEGNLKLLNSIMSQMLNLNDLKSIYDLITSTLHNILQDTYILCVSVDEAKEVTVLESVSGIDGTMFNKILKIIGFNPVGKTFKLVASHNQLFCTGNLVEFQSGLAEFSANEVSPIIAKAIEKLIGINKIYTIGINKDNNLFAAIHFFTLHDTTINDNSFIETFVKQAGIVIQKKIVQDQLKLHELELLELNASKDKLFSIIAHDLRSPFNGFLGLIRIMIEESHDLSIDEIKNFAVTMQSSASKLFALLENLLKWSSMQRGIIEYNPKPIRLSLLVNQNISIERETALQKDIQILINISDDCYVNVDEPMLSSVLRNLISNAIKFTYRGGIIEVGTSKKGSTDSSKVCLFVKDNGIGMDSDTLSKLFKLDEKVSRTGTENEPSSGLGLLLCKEFIEKHDGSVWIESELGKGSTFFLTLPKNVS